MIVHVNSLHEDWLFKCDVCREGFLTKDDMIVHVNSSHEYWRFQCDVCGDGFMTKDDMIVHVNSFHEGWCVHCDSSCVLFVQNVYHTCSICVIKVTCVVN